MSIAGKRAGLDGARSSLFYQAIRIIKEMRCATNGEFPRWVCWENVIGAFSSNQGFDFKAVLDAVIGIIEPGAAVPMPEKNRWPYADIYMGDGWSVAYRTFDAQHWGVPQRRRRCYLVGDLTDRCAGQVLFESEGLSGYSPESFRAWQRAAGNSPAGTGAAGGVCLNDQGGSRMDVSEEVAATLRAQDHGHPPCVLSAGFCTEHSADSRGIGYAEEISPTLRAGVVPAAMTLYENHPQDARCEGPLRMAPTISHTYGTGGNNQPFVVGADIPQTYAITTGAYTQVDEERAPTLAARDFKSPTSVNRGFYSVRRLLPTECATLQGFPVWWCAGLETERPTDTDIAFWSEVWEVHRKITGTSSRPKSRNQIIKWLQHPHSDAAEYKLWGNGVALPCVFFVLA
ncbi:MAG: DNA cytosine methyltransferase, partial [Oscillospiraceae bacterium]|nr:DNA cytosine methyltransferase [Oscillospiraceae bacterium]